MERNRKIMDKVNKLCLKSLNFSLKHIGKGLGVQKRRNMIYAEVSTQITGYVKKWGTGWEVSTVDKIYELMGLEQFFNSAIPTRNHG